MAAAREDALEYCHVSKHVLLSMLGNTLVLDGSVQEKEVSRPMIKGKICCDPHCTTILTRIFLQRTITKVIVMIPFVKLSV